MEISRSDLHATTNHLNARKRNLFILSFFLGQTGKISRKQNNCEWRVFPEPSLTFGRQKGKEQHLYFLHIMLLSGSHRVKKEIHTCGAQKHISEVLADFISTVQQVTATAFQVGQIKYWSGILALQSNYLFFYSTKEKYARKSLFSQSVWNQTCNLIGRRNILLLYFRQLFKLWKEYHSSKRQSGASI